MKYGGLAVLVVAASCASADYEPPTLDATKEDYSRTVAKSFDETWDALIQYAAKTFFAIVEKDSGRLSVSLGMGNPAQFVTGGYFKLSDQREGGTSFEGDYVDYLRRYANGTLTARMSIVVRAKGQRTLVTVNTRYVFKATLGGSRETWHFESGGSSTVRVQKRPGTPRTRTIQPTHKAERGILRALSKLN